MRHIFDLIITLVLYFGPCAVHAEELLEEAPTVAPVQTPTGNSGKKDRMNVLDFEGEVIEGERKKPDLILQIAPQDLSFESLLYKRTDFNDFLEVDKNTRPRFIIKGKK